MSNVPETPPELLEELAAEHEAMTPSENQRQAAEEAVNASSVDLKRVVNLNAWRHSVIESVALLLASRESAAAYAGAMSVVKAVEKQRSRPSSAFAPADMNTLTEALEILKAEALALFPDGYKAMGLYHISRAAQLGAEHIVRKVEAVTCEFNLAYKATECGHTKCSMMRVTVEAARQGLSEVKGEV